MVDNVSALCSSRKYPKPHHRGSLEISRRRGVLKAKIFKESMSINWNFQRGGGPKPKKKKSSMGGVWILIFLEQHSFENWATNGLE